VNISLTNALTAQLSQHDFECNLEKISTSKYFKN